MLYNTKLELCEPTKMLERITVDNLRFINPLGHDYLSGTYQISPTVQTISGANYSFAKYAGSGNLYPVGFPIPNWEKFETNIRNTVYSNIYGVNTLFKIYPLCFWRKQTDSQDNAYQEPQETRLTITRPDGSTAYRDTFSQTSDTSIGSLALLQVGQYTLTYNTINGDGTDSTGNVAKYTFNVVQNTVPKEPYTITQVINRILNAGLGRLNGYFKLDPAIASAWANIPAPEFEITGKTLYEALLMVGGYRKIQAIPRLGPTPGSPNDWEFNFITFDSLNGAETWTPPVPKLDYYYEQNANSYCGGIESYVDNFVDNTGNGTVGLPFPTTVRTESTELIINDNFAIIPTKFPIYKVNTLTQAYINSSGSQVGDITPFVFEKSEYDKLTSYIGTFPTAKQFAFYYIQGQPNIYGLCLKPQTATTLGIAIQQMAAVQIAQNKSGQSYNSTNGISAFAYEVNYTPISSRRLRQYRPYQGAYPNNNMLYYNQSANIVDSRNYGGRMKAELARIGNPTEIETYRLSALSQVPKAGMLKDGKYISQVNWEIGINYIKVSIWLVKNYNRLNEYIGINSMQRFYEVSEKQATQRTCNYSYFMTIGSKDASGSGFDLSTKADSQIANFLRGQLTGSNKSKVGFALVQPLAEDGTDIQSLLAMEVISNAFGNSMCFYIAFADNYSAGNQALYNASARKVQRAVPYGDEYGQLHNLNIQLFLNSLPKTTSYADQVSTSTQTAFCDGLPSVSDSDFNYLPLDAYRMAQFDTPTIDKNGGESLAVEVQIHFQANQDNIVIGSALAQYNPLIANDIPQISYVALPYIIQPLQEVIPTADVTTYKVAKPSVSSALGVTVSGITNTTGQTAQSWACVTEDGEIIFAVNQELANGAKGQTVYFNTTLQ